MRESSIEAFAIEESERRQLSAEEAAVIVEDLEQKLKNKERRIGFGMTAEVYPFNKNDKNCLKIIHTGIKYSTVHKKQTPEPTWYQPLRAEADFMEMARKASTKARVPRPYYIIEESVTEEEPGTYEHYDISALAMETMNAVTLRDILDGKCSVPKGFNPDSYFKNLKAFFEEINRAKLHHRDIHAGNVMVMLEDGSPVVIDFGCGVYANAEDAVTQEVTINKGGRRVFAELRFRPDAEQVEDLERTVRKHLENAGY